VGLAREEIDALRATAGATIGLLPTIEPAAVQSVA
jgi:hypothetical protein